jgi:hypothetical protein
VLLRQEGHGGAEQPVGSSTQRGLSTARFGGPFVFEEEAMTRRFYVVAWGHAFCMVHGWVPLEQARPMSEPVARIVAEENPGAMLVHAEA